MVNRENILPLVKEKAAKFNLDPLLLDAIIQIESAYNVYAVRFEEKSIYKVIPEKFARMNFITTKTEETMQKVSWGICQVMGSTARWLGFKGPLPMLCDPGINLNWACRYLSKLRDEHGLIENIISAYNAGSVRRDKQGLFSNQEYVNKVLKIYQDNKT